MIIIELSRGNKSLHQRKIVFDPNDFTPVAKRADAAMDELITDIHKRKFGPAPIRIAADFLDDAGQIFQGRHARLVVQKLRTQKAPE